MRSQSNLRRIVSCRCGSGSKFGGSGDIEAAVSGAVEAKEVEVASCAGLVRMWRIVGGLVYRQCR